MLLQTLRKSANAAALLLAVLVLNFAMIHLAPGDPVETLVGEMGGSTPELIAQLRQSMGLDRPLYVQIALYVGNVLQGDFGHSYYYDQPVLDLILARIGPTLLLVVTALFSATVIGTLLGVFSAQRRSSWLSHLVTVLSLAGFSAPVFWVGIMLILLLSVAVPIFPIAGMSDALGSESTLGYVLDVARHLVLPALTLGLIYLAFYSRLSRASMLEVLGSDYVRTARAKGLPRRLVIYKHALRNAILPVVTFAGLQFGQVISGAVLVETVFAWPGLGTLAFDSILRRDTPTLLGILFFSALMVVVMNLATDLVYRRIDPRIKTR
ncbi:ABC transporter permease [Thalassobaculum sp. OXR-137]|uniref:ABC transporter permease n=1 Tax=Thalassobaculum sp. OXR-137 TaxID=3100173 RepID=UPI002AC962E6|nr:ABC transporter permease [Thalassobaculum sp. OXR-137]WPZ32704.1 ABC transporter permease [Thalassobaculum sp. OXR-137]